MQQQEAVETEQDFADMDFVDMGYLAWEPEPDVDFADMGELAFVPTPDEDFEEMEQPEAVESEREENFDEIYDRRGETHFLIQVCRLDLRSHPLQFNFPNAVNICTAKHSRTSVVN
ncbi:hypothetical protein OROMI_003116 [Orobanche minor]